MISRATISEIASILDDWCENMDIEKEDLQCLVNQLAEVKANKSYADSMKALLIAFKDDGL